MEKPLTFGTCRRLKATLRLDPEREQRPSEGRHHLFSGESHVVFVELPDSDRSAKCVDELDSFGEKPAKTPRIWNVVDCFLVGSTASPNHYAWYLATAFKPLKKAGVGAPAKRVGPPACTSAKRGKGRKASATP